MIDIASSPPESPIQEVIDEAIGLLQELAFDTSEGASRQGERVIVSITPESTDQRYHVRVTCYARGHRTVDWAGLRLGLIDGDRTAAPRWLPLLNRRGQTRLDGLEPGAYQSLAYHRIRQRYQVSGTTTGSAAHSIPVQTAMRTPYTWTYQTQQTLAIPSTTNTPSGIIVDRPLTLTLARAAALDITLSPTPAGIRLTFETTAPNLAESVVEFCCCTPAEGTAERVLVRERVALTATPNASIWRGTWEGRIDPAEAFELNYRILPKANRLERDIVLPNGL